MDIEQLIKEEEHSPISLTDEQKELSCFMHFYPLDSSLNEEEQLFSSNRTTQQLSLEDIITMIEEKLEEKELSLRTAHMSDILRFAEINFNSQIYDWTYLRKGIVKRKRQLKRFYAKGRSSDPKIKKEVVIPTEVEGDQCSSIKNQKEIKKKRNRLSAQMSRDNKKQKMRELEENLRKMKEQADKVKLENEKLKKELNQVKEKSSFPYKNKLFSLLVMLGVIFLLSILKDLFKTGQSNLASFQPSKETFISPIEQQQLIGKGKEFLQQIEDEQNEILDDSQIKTVVLSKLSKLQNESKENVLFPKKLLGKIRALGIDQNL